MDNSYYTPTVSCWKKYIFILLLYGAKNHASFSWVVSMSNHYPSIFFLRSVPMTQLWNYSSKKWIVLVVFFELFLFLCSLFLSIVHPLNRLFWCVITCLVQIYFSFLKTRMLENVVFSGERERKWNFKYL